VISDDGEWEWKPEAGGLKGSLWERIVPITKKPGLATRLLVKKSAWGKPGLSESQQAAKLQPTRLDRGLEELGTKLAVDVERRKAERR
jgi:hypothetical protein